MCDVCEGAVEIFADRGGIHIRDRVLYAASTQFQDMLYLQHVLGGTIRKKTPTLWQWRTRRGDTDHAVAVLAGYGLTEVRPELLDMVSDGDPYGLL